VWEEETWRLKAAARRHAYGTPPSERGPAVRVFAAAKAGESGEERGGWSPVAGWVVVCERRLRVVCSVGAPM